MSAFKPNQLFKDELSTADTRYFIFDTGRKGHRDIDFEKYSWRSQKFNKVRSGDLLVYRTPQKASENGKFYFFGACKVDQIIPLNKETGNQFSSFSKAYPFQNWVFQEDLDGYKWTDKKKKEGTWEHFFNNYGMNEISRDDFLHILQLGFDSAVNTNEDTDELKTEIKLHNNYLNGNYRVEDESKTGKVRGKAQKVFSDQVKSIYENKCCVTGITSKGLLVGSHIIPWSEDKDKRLDPTNGLCLSALVDKCFDKGLISVSDEYRVLISAKVKLDKELFQYLKGYENIKIFLPHKKEFYPKKDYLSWHRTKFKYL